MNEWEKFIHENAPDRLVQLAVLHAEFEALHPYSIHYLDFMFSRPVFNASDFTNSGDIPKPTAIRILAGLRDNDQIITLREASGRRPAVYAFAELINIAEGGRVF